jgi:5-deoxy-glucuronate isomerase
VSGRVAEAVASAPRNEGPRYVFNVFMCEDSQTSHKNELELSLVSRSTVGVRMLFKAEEKLGYQNIVSKKDFPLRFLAMDLLKLDRTIPEYTGYTGDEEFLFDVFGGKCSILAKGKEAERHARVGNRRDVFAGSPEALLLPRRTRFTITTSDGVEMGIVRAPSDKDGATDLISSDRIVTKTAGKGNYSREVRSVLPPESSSSRLIVGEIVSQPGYWSGFPAHKHDTISEHENFLEEIYFYRMEPRLGYGIMRVYDKSLNRLYYLENNTGVIITRGYHSAVAAPHTKLFALWTLAGEVKRYNTSIDSETSI